MGDITFYDLDGLSTLKQCEKYSNSSHLGMWFTFYGRQPFYGHTYHLEHILGIEGPLTPKILRIWGCSLVFMDYKHLQTMRFEPKNINFGFMVHKLCSKTPKILMFLGKNGMSPYL